jgi:hypothetical protein
MRATLVTAFVALLAVDAAAQQVPCGGFHEVRQGETLQRIAVRAYGPEASWRTLWAANQSRLGGDPSLIEIGDLIFIPCLDAEGAASAPLTTTAPTPRQPGAQAVTVGLEPDRDASDLDAPSFQSALLVTDAPGGGKGLATLVTEALNREFRRESVTVAHAEAPSALATAFDADRSAVIAPVVRPDCRSASEAAAVACEGLVWSAPLREIVVTSLTRVEAADEIPASARRACLQSGLPRTLLNDMGFSPDTRVREGTAEECVLSVAADENGWAVVEASAGEAETTRAGLGAALVEHAGLARVATLHAVAREDSEGGRTTIEALDAALARMEASGRKPAVMRAALAADALTR